MGLFDRFKRKPYDLDTLAGIEAIPVPAREEPNLDPVYYRLQRKATEHKKNGRLDLAIACLRKSNALSDYEARPPLLEKDYLRLVKYIESSGDKDLAEQERKKIYDRHPDFLDKRISNKKRVRETLDKCKSYGEDLVYITTKKSCPLCSPYNQKTFSISGKSKKHPKLPAKIVNEGGFCPNCIIGISISFDGIK